MEPEIWPEHLHVQALVGHFINIHHGVAMTLEVPEFV